ncbi:MBL fold metallo-hydrolase [Halorubellus sp. JP-L1]|uniref:MBL fold metallo-hydrolase n=1 Tax=Halorubellus sp. JP-L1 TaxID=2715753 RepID=UPI00140C0730|nr:MBL fold metallo-hydrolase [Halorubellus sp. JP-L1]NHN40894.1 MBL fold metallo-hydrolase [Halorubellus sp. JP-L1]
MARTVTARDGDDRRVADGVYRFGTRRINWYVLEADDGLTLVDAGLPAHWPQLEDWLVVHDYGFEDVAALALTHGDPDHVGFARRLADEGVPVYLHPDDRHHLRNPSDGAPGWFYRNLWRPAFLRYAAELVRDGITSIDPVAEFEPISDGDVLPVPGEPRVLFAPGHTPGSCALYVEDRDVLFCGDVLATRNIFTGRESGPQLLGAADEDHEAARASLDRLAGLGTVTLLPGHGNPMEGDVDAIIDRAR